MLGPQIRVQFTERQGGSNPGFFEKVPYLSQHVGPDAPFHQSPVGLRDHGLDGGRQEGAPVRVMRRLAIGIQVGSEEPWQPRAPVLWGRF